MGLMGNSTMSDRSPRSTLARCRRSVDKRCAFNIGLYTFQAGLAKARFRARQSEFRRKPSCMTRLLSSWSRQDATNVYLPSAKVSIVRAALDAAAKNVGSRAETKLKQRTGLACLAIAF